MADNSLKSKLNMHGIVDLDQMAAVLSALVDQVDKQNRVIGDLQRSLSLYVKNDMFVERISKLESVVATAITRIDAIQEAATATAVNKKYERVPQSILSKNLTTLQCIQNISREPCIRQFQANRTSYEIGYRMCYQIRIGDTEETFVRGEG